MVLKEYRTLRKNEIVREGDEVKEQFGITMWTLAYVYVGKKVKDCYGYITGLPRTLRRRRK